MAQYATSYLPFTHTHTRVKEETQEVEHKHTVSTHTETLPELITYYIKCSAKSHIDKHTFLRIAITGYTHTHTHAANGMNLLSTHI